MSNYIVIILSALIPLIVGAIWYSKNLFGKSMTSAMASSLAGTEKKHGASVYILTFVFGIMISVVLQTIVIHQFGLYSTLMNESGMKDPSSPISMYVKDFMSKYGTNFRTFKHGAFHGTLTGLFLVFPVVAINSMFERRGWKYIFVTSGYWVVNLLLMGGILCAYVTMG